MCRRTPRRLLRYLPCVGPASTYRRRNKRTLWRIFYTDIEIDGSILTPKNFEDAINSIFIRRFGEETPIITLYSADTVSDEDGTDNIHNNLHPTEFLNSLCVQGFPLHILEL